jgi:hypothetical protein
MTPWPARCFAAACSSRGAGQALPARGTRAISKEKTPQPERQRAARKVNAEAVRDAIQDLSFYANHRPQTKKECDEQEAAWQTIEGLTPSSLRVPCQDATLWLAQLRLAAREVYYYYPRGPNPFPAEALKHLLLCQELLRSAPNRGRRRSRHQRNKKRGPAHRHGAADSTGGELLTFHSGAFTYRGGKRIPLCGKPWRVLKALYKASGHTLTLKALQAGIWKDRLTGEETIKSAVAAARKALRAGIRAAGIVERTAGFLPQILDRLHRSSFGK